MYLIDKILKRYWPALFTIIALFPLSLFAQSGTDSVNTLSSEYSKIKNPIGVDSVQGFVKTVLEGVIKIGIPLIALAIIYAGFLFIKAVGNPTEITKAKDALLNAIIGAAIVLGAWGLTQLISETILAL